MRLEVLQEVREWFDKVETDLRTARIVLSAEPPILGDAAFHCQQAIEKALKGFLAAHHRQIQKSHDLDELSSEVVKIDPSLETVLQPARELTVYATMYRYPGSPEDLSAGDLENDLALARAVYDAILSKLPEARP